MKFTGCEFVFSVNSLVYLIFVKGVVAPEIEMSIQWNEVMEVDPFMLGSLRPTQGPKIHTIYTEES